MANQEQLEILGQGTDVWNKWREENPNAQIDLTNASLNGTKLSGANLSRGDFFGVDFSLANLVESDFSGAILAGCLFIRSNLSGADLNGALLVGSYLIEARLDKTRMAGAIIGDTNFGDTDLSEVLGLEEAAHSVPSTIGTNTLQFFKGILPEEFLRGCGLSDWEIESAKLYNPDLTNEEVLKIQYRMFDLRATQALQVSPLFISYSHADKKFVDQLDSNLTEKGIRFWRDIHDAKAGRLETQIDSAIRQNPTVLLVLSKDSLNSDWVEHEVRHARKLEKELGRDALCPIALDDTWKSSPWPERIMEQVMEYNILDFSGWQDKSTFDSKLAKLLSGLEIFYKKPTS